MIRYWITGILVERPAEYEFTQTDVVWTGPITKSVVPYTVAFTEGGYAITVLYNDMDVLHLPYGYRNRRWATIALGRLIQKGKGFVPLLNVSSLKVRGIEYRDGGLYLLGGPGHVHH